MERLWNFFMLVVGVGQIGYGAYLVSGNVNASMCIAFGVMACSAAIVGALKEFK